MDVGMVNANTGCGFLYHPDFWICIWATLTKCPSRGELRINCRF